MHRCGPCWACSPTLSCLPLILVVDDLADLHPVVHREHQRDRWNYEGKERGLNQEDSRQRTKHDHPTGDLHVSGALTNLGLALRDDVSVVLIIEHRAILPMPRRLA